MDSTDLPYLCVKTASSWLSSAVTSSPLWVFLANFAHWEANLQEQTFLAEGGELKIKKKCLRQPKCWQVENNRHRFIRKFSTDLSKYTYVSLHKIILQLLLREDQEKKMQPPKKKKTKRCHFLGRNYPPIHFQQIRTIKHFTASTINDSWNISFPINVQSPLFSNWHVLHVIGLQPPNRRTEAVLPTLHTEKKLVTLSLSNIFLSTL